MQSFQGPADGKQRSVMYLSKEEPAFGMASFRAAKKEKDGWSAQTTGEEEQGRRHPRDCGNTATHTAVVKTGSKAWQSADFSRYIDRNRHVACGANSRPSIAAEMSPAAAAVWESPTLL
jgi:hypothetical protein